jgi:hypothetical protein
MTTKFIFFGSWIKHKLTISTMPALKTVIGSLALGVALCGAVIAGVNHLERFHATRSGLEFGYGFAMIGSAIAVVTLFSPDN